MKIGIIGGGIIGLTSGVVLAEAGHDVQIYSKHRFEEITSWAAAATGYPTNVEESERVNDWFARSNDILTGLIDQDKSGVTKKSWISYSYHETPDVPFWWPYVEDHANLAADACPHDLQSGIQATILHMDTGVYFPYMMKRFEAAGGRYDYRGIANVDEISSDFDCVINSTGIFAGAFAGDESVEPGRGQVVVVRNPDLEDCLRIENTKSYIYPRDNECILGGSYDVGDWSMEEDQDLTQRILDWAGEMEPRLKGVEVLSVRVGLRPLRPTVRLEREVLADGSPVIHNYGHGGAGYTLSWGCAQDVLKLVESA